MRFPTARQLAVILAVSAAGAAAATLVTVLSRQQPRTSDAEPCARGWPLLPDRAQEREIAAGEVHRYLVEADRDDFVDVVVDQVAGDVVVSLSGPDGGELLSSDGPAGEYCQEHLSAVAERGGTLSVSVKTQDRRRKATYRIRLAALRNAGDDDRKVAAASTLLAEGTQLLRERRYADALAHLEGGCLLWEQLPDRIRYADCLVLLGLSLSRLEEQGRAAALFEQAASIYGARQRPALEAWSLNHAGTKHFRDNAYDRAWSAYSRALQLFEALGDAAGQLPSVTGLAAIAKVRDDVQTALDLYERMAGLLDQLPEQSTRRALMLHNTGAIYLGMGELDRAFENLSKAEALYARIGNQEYRASSLNRLGEVCREQGDIDAAVRYHRQARAIRMEVGDRRGEGASLNQLGCDYLARDEPAEALGLLEEALELQRELKQPRSQAHALLNLGRAQLALAQPVDACRSYDQALVLFRGLRESSAMAEGLHGRARCLDAQGELKPAVVASAEALDLLQNLRTRPISSELRMSFFASVQEQFDFHIHLLMQLAEREPGAGHVAEALLTAERARVQLLVDVLGEETGGPTRRSEAHTTLRGRRRSVQQELNALEERRLKLADSEAGGGPGELEELERSIDVKVREYHELSSRIRGTSGSGTRLELAQLQHQVLDPDTVLLEYRLGDQRSYLWRVSTSAVQAFELAPRRDIDRAARTAYELLGRSQHQEAEAPTRLALCRLSELVLAPLAGSLHQERLVVVADGVLQYIPFAALPDPDQLGDCGTAEPLVLEHELVHAPSASVLALLDAPARSRTYRGQLAVVADPVFSGADERLRTDRTETGVAAPMLASAGAGPELERTGAELGLDELSRLPFSHQEAEQVLALVPAESRLGVTGLAARKDLVTGNRLAGYRVVHFATHGILHPTHPELSGIVLSRVDAEGRPVDGFLRLHEINTLQLPCELVVLSACRTALGQEVRGEGLISLARGFMSAGAQQVMVSLWRVSDRGTAVLMERFYRFMFTGRLAPAAALRQAQISMYRDPRRAAPYYWAPFVVQGTWRAQHDERETVD